MTPERLLDVPEVLEVHVVPSAEVKMVPEIPPATKVLFSNTTPRSLFPVGEITLSKDDPSSLDLTMFPEAPTATNFPPEEEDEEDVVVVLSVVVEVV